MAQRNNMVEQIGLRGSHFNLGNNNPNCFVTTNSTSFNNQEKKKQMPNIKQQDTESAVMHDKANLRASHFALGNQDPKNFYFTENSTQLKHFEDSNRAVLSEAQKKELRSHHFKLGQYAPTTQTMNNLAFDKKPIIEMKDQEKLKLFMRGHHHNFREMPNTIMTTKYNDDYNNEIDKSALKQGVTSEQMKEKALALRHSHIVLGKENPHFQSVQKQDYPQKYNEYKPHTKQLQGSNFALGNQKDIMCTTNDVFHNQQPIVHNPMAKETKADLRASHFTMGKDSLSYQTEFGNNFKKGQGSVDKATYNTAMLQQNHFSLAQDDKKQSFQTAYNQEMKKPDLNGQLAQMRDQKKDRGSNFKIGNQGNLSYTSEFSSNYQNQYGQPSVLNEAKKAELRSSHFQFNDIARNTYQTNYRTSFLNKDNNGKGELNQQKQGDLRQNHFNFGSEQINYGTTQKEFHKHPGNPKPPSLNQQQRADLRSHHFKLG